VCAVALKEGADARFANCQGAGPRRDLHALLDRFQNRAVFLDNVEPDMLVWVFSAS
jgi:hypothetical protein